MAYTGGLSLGYYERNDYLCRGIVGSNYPMKRMSVESFPLLFGTYQIRHKMKEIQLTQGKVALVDDEDYDFLMQWKWHAHKDYYSEDVYYAGRRDYSCGGNGKSVQMHRVIMKTPINLCVDHIDHNTLNNQKNNLRNCSRKKTHATRKVVKMRHQNIWAFVLLNRDILMVRGSVFV